MAAIWETLAAREYPPVADLDDRACRGADIEIFYPNHSGQPVEALKICGRCPHREPCLEWALKTGQTHGVWGATTPEQRKAMIRRTA